MTGAGPTPRQRARQENIDRIKRLALAQLAAGPATDLSLRAIARELNIVSSAIYRYYPSRDDLVTALIVDAYEELAAALEGAAAQHARSGARRRWLGVAATLRSWARDQPHRFALVYGSAIPGYAATETTIEPAARVIRAFAGPVVGHARPQPARLPRALRHQLHAVGVELHLPLDDASLLHATAAFASAVGLLTLELNGHFVGGFEPTDHLFEVVMGGHADRLFG